MPETGEPKRRVAIYGGSFNPPHLAHQLTVLAVLETQAIDEIWLVPTYRHAFAKQLAPFALRKHWCELLIHHFNDSAKVSDIEKKLGGESRTVDTLAELSARHPDCSFSLVLGSDIRRETGAWKRFDLLEARYPIIWIGRTGQAEQDTDWLVLPDISSSQIRARLANGESVDALVPKSVLAAMRQSGYRWED